MERLCCQIVECRPQGFGHQGEAGEHTDGGHNMGGLGALLASRLQPAQGLAAFQQLVEHRLRGVARDNPSPKLAQHRIINTGVRQVYAQERLPINTGADGLSGLPLRERFAKLPHRH